MIVRIATEGQFRVSGAALDKISALDGRLLAAVEDNDEREFSRLLDDLLAIVRKEGQPVPTAELVASDLILPPPDTTLGEAKRLFEVDGLAES